MMMGELVSAAARPPVLVVFEVDFSCELKVYDPAVGAVTPSAGAQVEPVNEPPEVAP